ncbi:MAG: 2-amino-4-hydroxy-6-hydroxymethyldihydropteridine diphosphokinase [Oscillospiraceae bacterium]|jgi:2-amino-4-hydroxy-6-hydroxymethyldihydropteridine diphosphokinase|nr:2-amino-4-hydroxy-6-hydroxymethyldihydropteridine diphosphokinase [Oscillospiraceae bacterium]
MSEAVIALGSNLGDRDTNLLQAVQILSRLNRTKVIGLSSIFESPAENPKFAASQDLYHNMCVKIETEISPMALLGACLGIEAAMGRVRTTRNASRPIDLDLLIYEGVKSESFELTLPHPRLLERPFVLLPLKELYPAGRAPGVFFEPYLKDMDTSSVRKIEKKITMEA